MMHKLLLLLLTCSALQASGYPNSVPIEELFSDRDLALSVREQEEVKTLIRTLKNSSMHEHIAAAQEAISSLKQEIEKRRLIYEAADEQDKPFIGYKAGIIMSQAHWLELVAEKMSSCLPLHKQASGFCKKYFKRLKNRTARLFNKQHTNSNLTAQLLSYARLERERIFSTYPSTVALAATHEHKDLPPLMAFWSEHRKQWLLLNQSKKYLYLPKVQMGTIEGGGEEALADEVSAAIEEALQEAKDTARQGAAEAVAQGGGLGEAEVEGAVEGASDVADDGVTATDASTIEKAVIEQGGEVNEETEELTNLEKVKDVVDRTAAQLKEAWRKIPGASRVDGFASKLFIGPIRGFLRIAKEMLPDVANLDELTANIAEGTLTEDLFVTPEAMEKAENTVEEFAQDAKSIAKRTRKGLLSRLVSKKVTQEELEQLSTKATEGDLSGAIKTQLTQARADAVRTLQDDPQKTVLDRALRWKRGLRSSVGRGLRRIDGTAGVRLSRAAEALRLSEAGLEGAGDVSEETQDLINQVKELREQLTTPLTKSGRYLRMMGNMNKALAANYPVLHGLIHMTLFMDAMMGGQLAISWENEAQAKEYLAMTKQRNAISAKFQSTISKIELTKEASMRQIRANKANLLTKIAKTNQKMTGGIIEEINYIVQSVAGNTSHNIYLSQEMLYDQYFYYSPMLTPNESMPLFPSQEENSPWVIRPARPLVLNQLTAGWIVSKSSSDAPTAPGTGAWIVGGKDPREPSKPLVFSKKFSIPKDFPTNAVAHRWHNPFRAGNWIFNPDHNRFFQYLIQPITSSKSPQGDANEALHNSIFTEYIPPIILNEEGITTYVVQVEMKIYQAEFPFFAGIFFNGGRWISGSKDLRAQHRLFGFYGNLEKKITLCGAETAYISTKDQLLEKTSLTALEQILAPSETQKSWRASYRGIIPNPLYPNSKENSVSLEVGKTYILTAATQPTRIMLMLEEKTERGLVPMFGPYTIIHRNPFIFLYHNIGFISGGCSTGFKLLQPKQLLYSQKSLDEFKRKIGLSNTTQAGRA